MRALSWVGVAYVVLVGYVTWIETLLDRDEDDEVREDDDTLKARHS